MYRAPAGRIAGVPEMTDSSPYDTGLETSDSVTADEMHNYTQALQKQEDI